MRATRSRPLPPALVVATLLTLVACGPGEPTPVRFSAIPDQQGSELRAGFDRVARYLSERAGVPVEYVPVTDYDAAVEAFVNGDVDLAWFGGVSGVQARERVEGAHAVAQGRVDTRFRSYFVARADLGLEPSETFPTALEGHSFTFGSAGSTSGRLMPEYFLRQATGKSPEAFFGHPNRYSGDHWQTVVQVRDGTVDAGAVNFAYFDRWVEEGELDPEQVVVLWATPTYADYNWTVRPDVDARHGTGVRERLVQALLEAEDPEVLRALQRPEGLVPATDADFDAVRATMVEVGLLER